MNNKEAFELIHTCENLSELTRQFLQEHYLPESEFNTYRYQFSKLSDSRRKFLKKNNLETWEEMNFTTLPLNVTKLKSLSISDVEFTSSRNCLFIENPDRETRKSLSQLTLKQVRVRLSELLKHIHKISELENTPSQTIAAYALHLISNDSKDYDTANVCKMIEEGTFGFKSNTLPLDKASYLLDMLEIGRRKYTEVRRLFLTENIHLPSFGKLSKHRCEVGLANFFEFINYNYQDIPMPIGIGISYRKIVHQTTERLLGTISNSCEWRYPLKLLIADGLDGSGSHRIYNQLTPHPDINTKSFLLFGFKIISLCDSANPVNRWSNPIPNSPFVLRPVALLTLEENHSNVKFLMDTLINVETANLEDNGIDFDRGHVEIKIVRSLIDGKMAKLCDGAGGASCQLCTASKSQLKDLYFVRTGYPINRTISSAKQIFDEVDLEEFLSRPSEQRFQITAKFTSEHDILPASPLHCMLRVFGWFMTLLYHLKAGVIREWSPSNPRVENAKKVIQEFLREHTGLKIDYPNIQGGTSTTGNVARLCFIRHDDSQKDFIYWVLTLIDQKYKYEVEILHRNLAIILRIMNSNEKVDAIKLEILCKDTYEFIINSFPSVSITPTLHKLLAHLVELIRDHNGGYGLKNFSEEALEASNKYIRRFRDNLARKTSYQDNIRDVIVRLGEFSDYGKLPYRQLTQNKIKPLKPHTITKSEQDEIFDSLLLDSD